MSIRDRRHTRKNKLKSLLKSITPKGGINFGNPLKRSRARWRVTQGEKKSYLVELELGKEDVLHRHLHLLPDLKDSILTQEVAKKLLKSLPRTYRDQEWERVFSSATDGYNLLTACSKVKEAGVGKRTTPGFMVVIQDENKHVLAAFSTSPLEMREDYYGNGEGFVAKLSPEFKVYKATGKNMDFLLTKEDLLAFGGGGSFALTLDSGFAKGTSCKGETYDNDELASSSDFKCVSVEIWTFKNPLLCTASVSR